MRESEKEQEELKAFCPKSFINGKDAVIVLVWGFYSQTLIQITKNYKSKHYYKEKVGRKPKR